jgi:hypothetical protein
LFEVILKGSLNSAHVIFHISIGMVDKRCCLNSEICSPAGILLQGFRVPNLAPMSLRRKKIQMDAKFLALFYALRPSGRNIFIA